MTKPSNDTLADAYVKARLAQTRMERAKADVDAAKAVLAQAGTGKHTVKSGTVEVTFTVAENNVYDDEAMLSSLRPGQFQRVSTRRLDRAKVRAVYPEVYAAAKQRRGFKVSL